MLLRKLYYLNQVMKQQWMKPKDLERIQERMLRKLIFHSYKYVPYYRRKWKQLNIRPEDIKSVEDLEKLPIITRDDVKKNYNDFISLYYRHLYNIKRDLIIKHTSGTTSQPLEVVFNFDAWDYLEAIFLRALLAAGYDIKKPLVYYWYEPLKREIYHKFGILRKIFISSKLPEEKQIEIILKSSPEYLYYYPSVLYSITKKIKWEGLSLNTNSIITHAELLSKKMEKIISNVFNAPVYDQYGMIEFFRIAWQCKEKIGYHIDSDSVIMEIIKDYENTTPDETGKIIITGLVNNFFPLIRYDTGDIGCAMNDYCVCGRGLPLNLKKIEGRKKDLVKLRSGRIFTERDIIEVIAGFPEIYKFSVNYQRNNKFKINLVLFKNSDDIIEKIRNNFEAFIGEHITLDLIVKDEISKDVGGKRDMVILR